MACGGDVLVISKVTPEETCHVAYIDALANADAIALARRIADAEARSFDCRSRAAGPGRKGQKPDVAARVSRQAKATFSSRSPPILVKVLAIGRPPRRQ